MPERKRKPMTEPVVRMRRGEKKLQTRRQVLAAALAEFREKGFEEASTAEIAARAGVSHGAVFTVEPSKERLAVAAFGDEVRSVGEQAFARAFARQAAPATAVMGIFGTLFDFYEGHQRISRVLLREMLLTAQPSGEGMEDRLLNDYLSGLRVLVQTAMARGKLPAGVDAESVAAALLGVYVVFLLARLNGAHPDRATHLERCRRAVLAVLGQ
jgi:AcrR family transcriptional regulator